MEFSQLLRSARRQAGLTQRELARLAATSQPAIARYERGEVTPSIRTAQRLLRACGYRLRLTLEPVDEEAHLTEAILAQTPADRLESLANLVALRERVVPR